MLLSVASILVKSKLLYKNAIVIEEKKENGNFQTEIIVEDLLKIFPIF